MNISNLELKDADVFTSYTDPYDSRINYTYARFIDLKSREVKYGIRITKYKEFRGGECDVSKWSEVTESEFINVKNMKR